VRYLLLPFARRTGVGRSFSPRTIRTWIFTLGLAFTAAAVTQAGAALLDAERAKESCAIDHGVGKAVLGNVVALRF
jgi:hypothetical protein